MDLEGVVRETAASLNLLDAKGDLQMLDSLAIIDLIVAIESRTQVSIPTASLQAESFESIESLVATLKSLTG